MKLKISELKPNPYKKQINKGKLDNETVKKIQSNIDELGLMGSIPIVKIGDAYHLISHHHRVEALKRTFGDGYHVDVDLKKYSQDQLLKGMVIENLTQRNNQYAEEEDNIVAVRNYLIKNKIMLDNDGKLITVRRVDSNKKPRGYHGHDDIEYGSVRQICLWLDKNSGAVIKKSTVADRIMVREKLSPVLSKYIEKGTGGRAPDDVVTVKQATALVRATSDHKEQEELLQAMRKAEGRPHELLSEYKIADDAVKEQVRSGEMDLKEVRLENFKRELELLAQEQAKNDKGKIRVTHIKKYQRETGNDIGHTNEIIFKTCAKLEILQREGIIKELDYGAMRAILDAGQKGGKAYSKFMEMMMTTL